MSSAEILRLRVFSVDLVKTSFIVYQGEGPRTKDPISSTAAGAAVSGRPRSTMTTTILYRVLLVVVHLTISLKELLAVICYRMMKLLTSGVCDGEPRSVPAIRHEASRRLRRLPVHLGIVVVEEDLHVVDIVKIVAWSMAVGISYITIYDYKGETVSRHRTVTCINTGPNPRSSKHMTLCH